MEQEEAIELLREFFPPGSRVHTVVRSRAAQSAAVSILVVDEHGIWDASGIVAAATGLRFQGKTGGVRVHGVGVDPAVVLVEVVSRKLGYEGEDRLRQVSV